MSERTREEVEVRLAELDAKYPPEDSRWKLQGDSRTFQFRCIRHGLVVLFDVARQDNASEVMVDWEDPEQRKQWSPA